MLALVVAGAALASLVACDIPHETRSARGGGRVLIAPGVGLARAKVHVERLDRYGLNGHKPGDVSASLGVLVTDEQGYFEPAHDITIMGIHRFRVTGGTYRDPISGELIQRDERAELRALYRFAFLEDKSTTILVTPVHTLIDARFRQQLTEHTDPVAAYDGAYRTLNAHFGDLDWRTVVPADVSQPAISPTEEYRAAFVLGGLMVLAENMRDAAGASPQAAPITTAIDALAKDLSEGRLDGNDDNNLTAGSGLEVGECPPPVAGCTAQPGACQLGACRPACSLYTNTLRTALAQATAAYIGTRAYPSRWNRTGIGSEDARPFLEALGRNPDPDLFGSACLETVDRMPPLIGWTSPTEAQAFVKGDLVVAISASDDSGDSCRAYFPDHPDEDGDSTNCVARFTLKTSQLADGPVEVLAAAVDRAGNERRVRRTLEIDNLAPVVAIDEAGYYRDARAWWTATPSPSLRGTLAESNPKSMAVQVAGQDVLVTVTGASWVAALPEGTATAEGTQVVVRAEDLAGNVTSTAITVRLDDAPPSFAALPTTVRDERSDEIGFVGVTPTHTHSGPPVTLGGLGCPDVYKHGYLLDEAPPPYGGEIGARNPLQWSFQLDDVGAGVDPMQTYMRVRTSGPSGSILLDWAPVAGADQGAGARRFDISLFRAGAVPIPGLGTYEGPIEIDLRGRDRFGHEVTGTRCWTHHPLAAPLHFSAGHVPGVGGSPAHPLSLNAHGLSNGRIQDLSSLLLNDNATGASTAEVIVSNGTAEPVYLQVTLTAPAAINASRRFSVVHDLISSETVDESCDGAPWICAAVPAPVTVAESFPGTSALFEPRFYQADASGIPVSLVTPCADPGCFNSGMVRTYRVDPRTLAGQIPRYVITSWLRSAQILRPRNAAYPLGVPDSEFVQNDHLYTGVQSDVSYCSATIGRGIPRVTYCTVRSYYKRRQSLDNASLSALAATSIRAELSVGGGMPGPFGSAVNRLFQLLSYSDSE
ncbi:MAG: hypothetical protein IPI49_26430 [Myxococcales bacterium]|nr:hypothetical protein [Myxococcales bacterium]